MTQGFMDGNMLYLHHFLMCTKAQAAEALNDFIQNIGIPAKIHTDNAKVKTLSRWRHLTNTMWIKQTTTKPYLPWQNKCEHEFGATRIHAHVIMEKSKCPNQLWDYAIEYVCYVQNQTAQKVLNWQAPLMVLMGDTVNISNMLDFEVYKPVSYYDNPQVKFPEEKAKLGWWLGIAQPVGQAMCYYILTKKGTVVTCSTVKPVDDADAPLTLRELEEFDNAVREILKPNEALDNIANPEVCKQHQKEALKVTQ